MNICRISTKKKTSCSFCGNTGHKITKCPVKQALGVERKVILLVEYLSCRAPYSVLNESDRDKIITNEFTGRSTIRHMKIHQLHTKCKPSPLSNPTPDQMVALVTMYDKYGKPLDGYVECIVALDLIISYIHKYHTSGSSSCS